MKTTAEATRNAMGVGIENEEKFLFSHFAILTKDNRFLSKIKF
jgi:hypothetical protein